MKKKHLRITFVTLAILILSIGIAMLSVTALDGDEIAVTLSEYEDMLVPVSSEGGLIEDELPSMGEITMGDLIGPSSPVAPNATNVTSSANFTDGVYALRNVGNGQLWMGIERNYVTPGYHMQQYAFGYSPADSFTEAGLFKITRVPSTDRFIIRSMLNNRLSFGFEVVEEGEEVEEVEVITKIIPADDADVEPKDTFYIEFSSSGCVLYPCGSNDNTTHAVAAKNTTASGAAGAPNSYLVQKTKSQAGTRARWEMQRCEGANHSSGYITSPSSISMGLYVGEPYTLKAYGWTTIIGANKITLGISDTYSDIASGVWNDNTESLTVTVHKAGKFRVNFYIHDASEYNPTAPSSSIVRTFYGNYMAVPPIEDGMNYFIQNMGTKRYMDVEGPSTAEGAIIQQWNFSTAIQKKWIFTRESGGYFTIKSAYSNKYVGVDSTNTSVIRQYGTKNDYTKWYFESTTSGRYAIYCKASDVTGVLASPTASSGNGVNLTITAYTDNTNCRDEWECYVSKYDFQVVHYYDRGYAIRYTTTNETANAKLRTYDRSVAERFMRIFGVNSISSFSEFESPVDKCKIDLNGNLTLPCLDNQCGHAVTHLTTSVLRNSRDNGTALSPIVIWTGHVLHDGTRSNSTPYSIVITDYLKVENKHVDEDGDQDEDYVNLSEEKIKQESEFDLLHELSHQLGAKDHYCYGKKESGKCDNPYCDECVNGYSSPRANCVMARRYNIAQRTDDVLYCNDCISLIQQYIENNQ